MQGRRTATLGRMRRSFIVTAVLALSLTALAPVARAADPEPVAVAGVTIGGIDVAGLTKAQAVAEVNTAYTCGLVRVHAGAKLFKLPVKRMKVVAPEPRRGRRRGGAAHDARRRAGRRHLQPPGRCWRQVASVARSTAQEGRQRALGLEGPRARRHRREGRHRRSTAPTCASTLVAALRHPADREITAKLTKVRATLSRAKLPPAITISRAGHKLHLYRFGKGKTILWRRFGVATGQAVVPDARRACSASSRCSATRGGIPPSSPWAKGAKPIPPGPGNPLGTRWMGISSPAVGIHGTPDAASIGYSHRTAASACGSPTPSGSSTTSRSARPSGFVA